MSGQQGAATSTAQQANGQPWLSGIIPPVATPLTADGDVDTASLQRHVEFLLAGGVHGLFSLGSSSEAAYLTDEQRDTVLEVVVKTASGQVPVLAGAIDSSTNRVVQQARRAAQIGVDAIVSTLPFFHRQVHPEEAKLHFRTISAELGLPVVAYDIPVAVHEKLGTALALEMAKEGWIQGLKDSSGDVQGFRALVIGARSIPGFSVFTGSEGVVDCVMLMGAAGAVPGLCNLAPRRFVELYDACRAGDWTKAVELQERLLGLFEVVSLGNPSRMGISSSAFGGFVTGLHLMGIFETNVVAPPLIALKGDEVEAVRRLLEREGII